MTEQQNHDWTFELLMRLLAESRGQEANINVLKEQLAQILAHIRGVDIEDIRGEQQRMWHEEIDTIISVDFAQMGYLYERITSLDTRGQAEYVPPIPPHEQRWLYVRKKENESHDAQSPTTTSASVSELQQSSVPSGFIALNRQLIRVRVNYQDPFHIGEATNFPEKEEVIAAKLCAIGNAIMALPVATDVISFAMPEGGIARCVIKHRYFSTDPVPHILNGIVPDVVVHFAVERTH